MAKGPCCMKGLSKRTRIETWRNIRLNQQRNMYEGPIQKNKDWNLLLVISKENHSPAYEGPIQKNKDWNSLFLPERHLTNNHVWRAYPKEQGLKHEGKYNEWIGRTGMKGLSKRTRIETYTGNILEWRNGCSMKGLSKRTRIETRLE